MPGGRLGLWCLLAKTRCRSGYRLVLLWLSLRTSLGQLLGKSLYISVSCSLSDSGQRCLWLFCLRSELRKRRVQYRFWDFPSLYRALASHDRRQNESNIGGFDGSVCIFGIFLALAVRVKWAVKHLKGHDCRVSKVTNANNIAELLGNCKLKTHFIAWKLLFIPWIISKPMVAFCRLFSQGHWNICWCRDITSCGQPTHLFRFCIIIFK